MNKKVRKILLLEDEETLGGLYTRKLQEAGFEVEYCKSKAELKKVYKTFHPDVAFLDYALYDESGSGADVIPILREENPDIKIIMLSNLDEISMDKKEGEEALAYLRKIDTSPAALVSYTKSLFS